MLHGLLLLTALFSPSIAQNDVDFWNVERPLDMANIASLEVMCGKTHMEVQISFDRPFNGIIFSKGAVDQYNCIYVKPQTGATAYSFNIMYDQVRKHCDQNQEEIYQIQQQIIHFLVCRVRKCCSGLVSKKSYAMRVLI